MHLFRFAIASVLLSSRVSADFDLWLRQTCTPDTRTGNTETCTFDWLAAPAYVAGYCDGMPQPTVGGYDDQPCEKWLSMNAGKGNNGDNNTIIHNCANNYNAASGAYYGDVLHYNADGTTVAGTCYVWSGASGNEVAATCTGLVELLLSRVACKISGVDGRA
jgi:hypothetical protein